MYLQWKDADQNKLMENKLKCVFALPPEQNHLEVKHNDVFDSILCGIFGLVVVVFYFIFQYLIGFHDIL